MAFGKVPAPTSTVTDTTSGLVIVVSARRNYFLLAFLSVWLVAWACGWTWAFHQLTSRTNRGGIDLFLLVWITGWTLGGGFWVFIVGWWLAGRERILLGPSTLSIRREILGMGRKREYAISEIRNLRVAPQPYNPVDFRSGLQSWGLGGGVVAFDYGADTVRFAAVQEAEGEMIVNRLRERQPFPNGDNSHITSTWSRPA